MRWRKASSRQVALSLRLPSSLQEPLADIELVRGKQCSIREAADGRPQCLKCLETLQSA